MHRLRVHAVSIVRATPLLVVSLFVAAPTFVAVGCGGPQRDTTTPSDAPTEESASEEGSTSVAAALAGAHRSDEDRARDVYRHPEETLAFFGLEPSMTVLEMAPGGGWYTAVLAPVLHAQGRLIVAIPNPEQSTYSQSLLATFAAHPEVYDRTERVIYDTPTDPLGPEGSVDMVLTFRSAHGWINRGGIEAVMAAMFRVLRPGGVLGFVQHRADDGADPVESARQGYVPESYIVELATNAGFVLEARSDINRNPNDDHQHPEGVWTLPPTLRLGDTDREQWVAIGESDRMTLRFRKPTDAPTAAPTTP